MDYLFYKLPQDLCTASGFVSKKDGSFIPLTSSAKLVYVYVLHRNQFFVTKKKGEHFETQTTIAEACGVEYRTVMRIMKDFRDNGVVVSEMKKTGGSGYVRYFYKFVDADLVLWTGKKEDPKILERKKYSCVVDKNGEFDYSDEFLGSVDFYGNGEE